MCSKEFNFQSNDDDAMKYSSLVQFFLFYAFVCSVFGKDLSGVYIVDAGEQCDFKGPFIFDQQRSSVAIRFGTTQIGVGSVDADDRLDLYLNKNRCKGLWKSVEHVAELKCQSSSGNVCLAKLRCVSGECQQGKSNKNVLASGGATAFMSGLCVFSSVFLLLFT